MFTDTHGSYLLTDGARETLLEFQLWRPAFILAPRLLMQQFVRPDVS